MKIARTYFLAALLGGALGILVATLAAPGFMIWYNTPGTPEALCSCEDLVRRTVAMLTKVQGVAAVLGAIMGIGVAAALGRMGSKPVKPAV